MYAKKTIINESSNELNQYSQKEFMNQGKDEIKKTEGLNLQNESLPACLYFIYLTNWLIVKEI